MRLRRRLRSAKLALLVARGQLLTQYRLSSPRVGSFIGGLVIKGWFVGGLVIKGWFSKSNRLIS